MSMRLWALLHRMVGSLFGVVLGMVILMIGLVVLMYPFLF
jgi:tetrahydromethanopterin S-methyltransferase subunit G